MSYDKKFYLVVNGVQLPPPVRGLEIVRSQLVNSGRNTNGTVVAQKIGRKLYKLNNLSWKCLTADQWKTIQDALEPFFVNVSFYDDSNELVTIKMYPGDTNAKPYWLGNVGYDMYEECKFNLIDCGE
jgi:hypothetical protein